MPSAHQPVRIPDELRGDRYQDEEEVPGSPIGPIIRDLLALLLIVLGAVGIGIGVGTWVDPGAGLAAAGLATLVVGVVMGFTKSE